MDVASRRVLGFSLDEHHDAGNAYGALAMAVAARGGAVPGASCTPIGAAEYTAGTFRQAC
jgi:putative transposase